MIIVKILGGLGNQMFQYAMGRKIAHLHNTTFQFEIEGLLAGEDIRSTFELGIFNIPDTNFVKADELIAFKRKTRFKSTWLNNQLNKWANRKMIVEAGHFHFNEDFIKQSTSNCYIRGLWQSEKYFKDVEDMIRNDFSFKFPMKGNNLELANHLASDTNFVSLHVRRGEFANNPKFNQLIGSCDMSYYAEAMKYIENKLGKVQYVVFSDDIPWVKENLPLKTEAVFVDYNMEKDHYRDMQLMSLCQHHIIANSTFSWWGAWLNPNPDKLVIAPKQWFANINHNTKDLIPDNWMRI
nr:alpha-1,2-fucosyltransferase [uncultured Carboxylicivirga sp.]